MSLGVFSNFLHNNSLSTVDQEDRDLEKDFESIEITFHIQSRLEKRNPEAQLLFYSDYLRR